MQAVILAAGKGSRLGAELGDLPKPLIPVGKFSLIERQIQALHSVGVTDILIVVGYKKEQIIALGQKYPKLRFVENQNFAQTNTIYSLWTAFPHLQDDFFYFNADVLMAPTLLQKLLSEPQTGLAVDRHKCAEEEVKFTEENRNQRKVITSLSKKVDLNLAQGEFVGIALFRKQMHSAFYQSLCSEIDKGNVQDYFEKALDNICPKVDLFPVDVSDECVIEIDFPEDLKKAKELVLKLDFE